MDIDIQGNNCRFKLRTSGIVIKDNKVLVQKSKKFEGYIFPGGHIEFGELSKEAILREIKEETNLDIEIKNLICVVENVYNNNDLFHEINYYYRLNVLSNIDTKEFTIIENDKGIIKEQNFYWINIEDLVENNVKPLEISKLLRENKNAKNMILEIDNRNDIK